MSTAFRILSVVVLLGLVLAGLFGWRFYQMRQQAEMMAQAPPPVEIETVVVKRADWRQSIAAIGSVRAANGVEVANEVAGVVSEINFESGQRVERGDVLLRLDAETDTAVLETREAEARLARQQFERFRNLVGQNAVSQAEFDEARANYDAAEARVHEQQAFLAKKTIRAPFSGELGLRLVDLGEFLDVGTPIVGINMLDPIQVDFTLPEAELPNLAVGDAVEVQVAAWPERTFSGRILALDSSVQPQTRTIRARARLDNPEFLLRPGMFADVRAIRQQTRTVLTVPRTAISFNTFGDFVFRVVDSDRGKTVERVSVTSGEARDGEVELIGGVAPGDVIVRAGLLRLRAGQPVRVTEGPAEPR